MNSERNWTAAQGRDHELATFCGSSLTVVQREAQIVGINTAGRPLVRSVKVGGAEGGGYATHLRCSTNILPSRCFNDWRFANRAKPSDGNCASKSRTREASALSGGWLCVEGARWLPGIYRPPLGEGQQGEARVKATVVGIKDLRGSGHPSLAVLLSDRFSRLVPSVHHRQPASRAKCFGPAPHHN